MTIAERIAHKFRLSALQAVDWWMTASDVEALCPPCAEKMRALKIAKVKASAVFGQDAFRVMQARVAAWDKLPKGWTEDSLKSFWNSIGGEGKHRVTACMKKMEGKIDDPGAFCASLADKFFPGWRSKESSTAQSVVARFIQSADYQEYVERKKSEGEKPLTRDEWEVRVEGKGKKDEAQGKDDKAKVKAKKGGHDLIEAAGGHSVLLAEGTKKHITGTHTKPGKGSVFNPNVKIEQVQKAIASIPEDFLAKGGGAYEVKVPHAGYDLVQKTLDILKKHPDAKKVTVKKEERGKVVEVTGYIVDNPIDDFESDTMSVVVRPTTEDSRRFLPEDMQKDEDMDAAIKDKKAMSVLSAWPGKADVPPASAWSKDKAENDYAVIIPNGGKGADWGE